MLTLRLICLLASSVASASATGVFVMLPLDIVTDDGKLKDESALASQLDKLKDASVEGVATDMWWGVTEKSPKQYTFEPYQTLVSMLKQRGMTIKLMASFHQCGGNVGDTCNIPIPPFVHSVSGLWYKDKDGNEDKEYVSLFADNVTVSGRTPMQMYSDWLKAFAATFDADLGKTITTVQIGMGPAGELRYPAYPLSRWKFCGVGQFQAFDSHALASFRAAAKAAGHAEWDGPPTDAGDYNSRPDQTNFFNQQNPGSQSAYGKFFLDWYFSSLKDHADAVLTEVRAALGNKVDIAGKVAGIHWWYKSPSHAAELTAGYYNTNMRNAYAEIAEVFSAHSAHFDFTCLEMADSEQDASCASGPEELVNQVISATGSKHVPMSGENALPRFDNAAYAKIESYRSHLTDFVYLRLSDNLLSGDNFNNFKNFVNGIHAGSVVV